MRLSTILPVLAVICSVQVLAIPTQRSGIQSDSKSSMMDPKVESSVLQNNEQNQSSETKSKDHTSSEENSPKDSADRIRKIVEAALASRRATKPRRRFYFTSNNKEAEGQEISETSNRKSDEISQTNTSMSLTNDGQESINPVRSSTYMIKKTNTPSNIRRPHIVNNGDINNNSNKASNRRSESALLIKHTTIPRTKAKTKPQVNMNIMPSSHTFSRSSDSEDPVPAIDSKTMPSSQQKTKIISIRNRNNYIKSRNSDLASTADTKSLSNLQINPSAEGSYIFNNNKYSNFKFISPWEKRTEVGRKTQHDAIRELIGRHVLSFNSKESQESHKIVSKTQYGSIVRSSLGSPLEKNVEKYMSSSEKHQLHSKNTTPISNSRRPVLSFNSKESQESHKTVSKTQYGSIVRPSLGSPLEKNVEKDMSSSEKHQLYSKNTTPISNSRRPMQQTLKSFRNIKPKKDMVQLEQNTNSPKAITENNANVFLSTTTEVHIPTMMSVDIKEPIHATEISDVETDITENIKTVDQIQPTLTNNNDYSNKMYQTPSDRNKSNQEQVIHSHEKTTDTFNSNLNNTSNVNESLSNADALESMKTSDQMQLTFKNDYNNNNNNNNDAHQISIEEHEGNSEQVFGINERELKKSIINMALEDYSDVIGSLVDYVELGTLDYDESDEKPAERKDLSQMIVDLFFKVTGR